MILAHVVYEGDRFSYRYSDGRYTLLHWSPEPRASGTIVGAWASARLPDGGIKYEVVSRFDIDRARELCASDSWRERPAAMARRMAVRRLVKTLPAAPDLTRQRPTPPENGHPVA